MKTHANSDKRASQSRPKNRPYVHQVAGPTLQTQQSEIRRILQNTGVQTKLTVGQANDQYEQEADRVADQVMRMPAAKEQTVQAKALTDNITPLVQRQGEEEEEAQTKLQRMEEEEEVQAKLRRQEDEEEELQTKLQRQEAEEEEVQAKLQRQEAEEEEAQPKLQRQEAEEEEAQPKLQRQEAEEEEVQAKLQRQEEEEQLQAKGKPKLDNEAEQKIQQMKGQGEPLPKAVRQEMENKISANFSAVRIHNNSSAHDLNKKINARAFTLGKDIFFGPGEFAPASERGKRLLAHELTHVVQQNSNSSSVIRRTEDINNEYSNADGAINTSGSPNDKILQIKNLRVPNFKRTFYRNPLGKVEQEAHNSRPTWRRNVSTGGDERNTSQITEWERGVREEADSQLDSKLRRAHSTESNGNTIYYFSYNRGNSFLFGTEALIKQRCRRPLWTRTGQPVAMQVDHQIEYQTYGKDEIVNMWLLSSRLNGQSGMDIKNGIREKVGAFVTHVQDKVVDPPTSVDDARTHYKVYFDPILGGAGSYSTPNEMQDYYTQTHIKSGDHLAGIHPMSQQDINRSGILDGNAETINIFPASFGGYRYTLTKDQGSDTYHLNVDSIRGIPTQNFEITSVDFNAQTKEGNIHIRVPSQAFINANASKTPKPMDPTIINPIAIAPLEGVEWGGKFDAASLKRQVRDALTTFRGLSPLHIDEVDLNANGIALTGSISPTAPLLENASVNFALDGSTLSVWKTFTADEFNVPAPLSINGATLSLGINNRGLFVNGNVGFGIDKVGEGSIGAAAQAGFDGDTGMSLSGEFNFDERIFGEGTQAQVRVGYESSLWSMGGTISIPEGKVPGVNSATINVDYSEAEGFAASGEAELNVPGVESGRLQITHNEESGFSMGGEFSLSSDTPGIRSGTISAEVTEKEDGSGYALSASGTAVPDIPGVDSELTVNYNDGAFTAEVTAQYQRGMLSGEIEAGVTNRSVNEETGELSDTAEENNPLIVYGGGSLTLQLAPWLQGTAGVRFAPNGEITVTGEIGLPNELEIFSRREINKSIFNIAVQAPIFPGIVAEIGGGLSATAGIGPGVVDQLRLGIEYNPDREQDTRITGDAHLNIPADAGLRLAVRAGIGLGITGASATGGLEIGGTLGIAGAAEAGVHIEWTPATGLDLRANVGVHAQPNFTFDISGYVSVRALGFSVYDERWQLASYTFGSDYRFGINLPIHYQEGQPFDISLNDVEFEVPDIDTNQLLRRLISRIA